MLAMIEDNEYRTDKGHPARGRQRQIAASIVFVSLKGL